VARLTKAALGYAVAVGLLAAAPTLATAVAACALAGVAFAAAGIGHWPARGGQVPDLVPPAP
jgi:hypothetical protein